MFGGGFKITVSDKWLLAGTEGSGISLDHSRSQAYVLITPMRFAWMLDETAPKIALQGVIDAGLNDREDIANVEFLEETAQSINGLTIRSFWYSAHFKNSLTFYCFSYILFTEAVNLQDGDAFLLVVQSMSASFFNNTRNEAVAVLGDIQRV
jgi:hypothetical protein